MLRTGSRPRRQIYVDYFYPSDENPTFNPSCSAAECPQHSLAEAERIFPKGPGVSRSQQTGKIMYRCSLSRSTQTPDFFARSVFVMTVNLSSMNSCAKRIYTFRKYCSNVLKPNGATYSCAGFISEMILCKKSNNKSVFIRYTKALSVDLM